MEVENTNPVAIEAANQAAERALAESANVREDLRIAVEKGQRDPDERSLRERFNVVWENLTETYMQFVKISDSAGSEHKENISLRFDELDELGKQYESLPPAPVGGRHRKTRGGRKTRRRRTARKV